MISEAISECIFSWWECAQAPLADVCYTRTECAHAVPMQHAHPGYTTACLVIVSSISLHRTTHIQTTDEDDVIGIATRESNLHVSNMCEGSSMKMSVPKPLGREKG